METKSDMAMDWAQGGSMSILLLFWVLMVIWFIFGLWSNWPLSGSGAKALGESLLVFILLAILGWAVFGPAIHR